jgi:hypothetical protein
MMSFAVNIISTTLVQSSFSEVHMTYHQRSGRPKMEVQFISHCKGSGVH